MLVGQDPMLKHIKNRFSFSAALPMPKTRYSYRHFDERDGVVNEVADVISRAMVVDHRSMVGLVGKAANRGDNETSD